MSITAADTFRTQDDTLTRNQLKVLRARARRELGIYVSVKGLKVGSGRFVAVASLVEA
jgi:hypothetical protein